MRTEILRVKSYRSWKVDEVSGTVAQFRIFCRATISALTQIEEMKDVAWKKDAGQVVRVGRGDGRGRGALVFSF